MDILAKHDDYRHDQFIQEDSYTVQLNYLDALARALPANELEAQLGAAALAGSTAAGWHDRLALLEVALPGRFPAIEFNRRAVRPPGGGRDALDQAACVAGRAGPSQELPAAQEGPRGKPDDDAAGAAEMTGGGRALAPEGRRPIAGVKPLDMKRRIGRPHKPNPWGACRRSAGTRRNPGVDTPGYSPPPLRG